MTTPGYRRPVTHEVYLVEWPNLRMVKIGISHTRRYGPFRSRGGVLRDVIPCVNQADTLAIESELHQIAREHFEPAFECARDAESALGSRGAGYTECYRASWDEMAQALLEHMPEESA